MSARQKLNRANLNGALLLGLVFGWMYQSFIAFVLATLFFLASAWYAGDIRAGGDYHFPAPPNPPRPRIPNHRSHLESSRRQQRPRR